jgi:hypothetical protein
MKQRIIQFLILFPSIAAVLVFCAAPAKSMTAPPDLFLSDRTTKGCDMNQKPNIPEEDIVLVLNEAVRYGIDAMRGNHGAHCFRRISEAVEKGMPIDAMDYLDLKRLVERAEKIVTPMDFRLAFNKVPPPDIIGLGDIFPYTLADGTPVGVGFSEMVEHIRWTGMSGSTKTTGATATLDASIAARKSCFIIDSKGEGQLDYLCGKYPGRVLKVRIGKEVFFNPWRYYHDIREYFLRIFYRRDSRLVADAAYDLSERQNNISGALAVMHNQLIENVVTITAPPDFPKIPQDFIRSMWSCLYDIQQSALSESIRCQKGWDLTEIIKRGYSVLIDSSAIAATSSEEFIVCSLISAIRAEIKADPDLSTRSGATAIVYIDECITLASAVRADGELPSLVHLATLVRSSGLVLICAYHSPTGVHPVLHSGYFCFACTVSNGNDLKTCQRMFCLSDMQMKALSTLPKGVAVMRMAGRFTDPILIAYPRLPISRKMTDAEVLANNGPILATLPAIVPEDYVPVIRVSTAKASPPVTATTAAAAAAPATAAATAIPSGTPPNDYLIILRDLVHNPFWKVSDRASRLLMSSGKRLTINELKVRLTELEKQGFCGFLEIQVKSRNGTGGHYYFPTAAGHAAIGSIHTTGRGGDAHDFAQRFVQDILAKKGITAVIEDRLPGTSQPVDLGVRHPMPVSLQIPISTVGSAHEYRQAMDNLRYGWARVIEVCVNTGDLKKLIAEFRKAGVTDPRISACVVADINNATMLSDIYDNASFFV